MAAKGNYKSEDEKKKWMELEVMSSDQSGDDGDQIIMVHPLPWLSAEVVAFKQHLDEPLEKEKSPQAHHQMKPRVVGALSTRPSHAKHTFAFLGSDVSDH